MRRVENLKLIKLPNPKAMKTTCNTIIASLTLILSTHVQAQQPYESYLADFDYYTNIGQLKTRHAKEIDASTWSIGGETLDCDFADYQSYKKYLGPLGAKKIRLQGGWGKTEKKKGNYNFQWMDDIVNDAYAQGVSPWIELAYGNAIYEGGGEPKLGGALPTSPEALDAWDHWVRASVTRYQDKVNEWEVWNEPDHGKGITGKTYAQFLIRTARVIKSLQPDAKILGMAMASLKELDFVKEFYEVLKQEQATDLMDVFVYHGYMAPYGWSYNPDDVYVQFKALKELVHSYNPDVVFMQGESGAPSTPHPTGGVFKDYRWSEVSQSKWNLRRMLGDYGRGINTSLFAISDMHYGWPGKDIYMNTKGLLKTNENRSIERPKIGYKAAQHVFSLFDHQIQIDSSVSAFSNQPNQSIFSFQDQKSGKTLVSIWQNEHPPYENYSPKITTITVEGADFDQPVLVDLISGAIYELPNAQWATSGDKHIFGNIPVADYPLLLTDKAVVIN